MNDNRRGGNLRRKRKEKRNTLKKRVKGQNKLQVTQKGKRPLSTSSGQRGREVEGALLTFSGAKKEKKRSPEKTRDTNESLRPDQRKGRKLEKVRESTAPRLTQRVLPTQGRHAYRLRGDPNPPRRKGKDAFNTLQNERNAKNKKKGAEGANTSKKYKCPAIRA